MNYFLLFLKNKNQIQEFVINEIRTIYYSAFFMPTKPKFKSFIKFHNLDKFKPKSNP